MIWFGESWGAGVCNKDTVEHVVLPAGVKCFECHQELGPLAQGIGLPFGGSLDLIDGKAVLIHHKIPHLLYHIDCFLANID